MQWFEMKGIRNSLSEFVGERTLYVLFSAGCWLIILVLMLVFVYFYSYLPEQRRHHDAFNLDPELIESIEFSPLPSGPVYEKFASLIDKRLTVTDPATVLKITDALRSAEHVARKDAGLNEIRTRCSMAVNSSGNRYRYSLSLSRTNCIAFYRQSCYRVDQLKDLLIELPRKNQMELYNAR